ncbi:MAG: tetratricopeptide repeat protein [Gemmataceae bacterium]
MTLEETFKQAEQLRKAGDLGRAESLCLEIIQAVPQHGDALHTMSLLANQTGRRAEALDYVGRAIIADPRKASYHLTLGNLLRIRGDLVGSLACFEEAFRLQPDHAIAVNNIGGVLLAFGRYEEAVTALQKATELNPRYAAAHANLGVALRHQGRIEEAAQAYARALELTPHNRDFRSKSLLCEQYRVTNDAAALACAHAKWEQHIAAPLRSTWREHQNNPHPDRPLRLGVVSADFYVHPVGGLSIRGLEALDRSEFSLHFYSMTQTNDHITERFRNLGKWHDIRGKSDEAVAEKIRLDQIDILIDMSGHTRGNRLLVFARKPAPIQIAWLGSEGTLGLAAFDWLIADEFVIPVEEDRHYSERILRLPNGYVSFDPGEYSLPISPLPMETNGYVTFGSFSNPAKLNSGVIDLWSRALRQLPESRLLLKYRGFDDVGTRDRFVRQFVAAGVHPEQLLFAGWSSYYDMLKTYGQVDLALDTFPFSGSATTLNALWMGVPVVTLVGSTFAGRHGYSHLKHIGRPEFVTHNTADYLSLVLDLARDPRKLATYRATLRQELWNTLCEGGRLGADLGVALRRAWREWCAGARATETTELEQHSI